MAATPRPIIRAGACCALTLSAAAMAGPISKWDSRTPEYRYVSSASMYDAERCMIDTEGWPASIVYRQPDRPDRVTILYVQPDGKTRARVDFVTKPDGLHVTSWDGPKAVRECAPEKQ
ncbi:MULTISPECIES: hypothetical protein [Sphingomonadales]|uniref:hypothetical protein n=1 Tax=Sphingomonadales TaxID=204457 RepID=UPI0012E3C7BC|nr:MULTISPECIES: hypothetical protein [Sphingomonadales]